MEKTNEELRLTTLTMLLTLLNDSMEIVEKVAAGEEMDAEITGRASFLVTQFKNDYSGVAEAAFPRIAD